MENQFTPYGSYYAPTLLRELPSPPRLHWGWILALNLITRGLFSVVWLLVQANWVRKVRGKSNAFIWAIIHLCFFPLIFVGGFVLGLLITLFGMHGSAASQVVGLYTTFIFVGLLVLYYGTTYTLCSELEAQPIAMTLGGVMTFFFGTIYFQYHLRDFEWASSSGTRSGLLNLSQPEEAAVVSDSGVGL